MRRLLVLVGLTGSLLLVGTGSASAANVLNVDVPFDLSITNPCNGDPIAFTGTIHLLISTTVDATGSLHIVHHKNTRGATGLGESGSSYRFVGEVHETDTVIGPTEYGPSTRSEHDNIIGSGRAPNFVVIFIEHITTNANGDVTSLKDDLSFACP